MLQRIREGRMRCNILGHLSRQIDTLTAGKPVLVATTEAGILRYLTAYPHSRQILDLLGLVSPSRRLFDNWQDFLIANRPAYAVFMEWKPFGLLKDAIANLHIRPEQLRRWPCKVKPVATVGIVLVRDKRPLKNPPLNFTAPQNYYFPLSALPPRGLIRRSMYYSLYRLEWGTASSASAAARQARGSRPDQ